jgi:hypothetical protein
MVVVMLTSTMAIVVVKDDVPDFGPGVNENTAKEPTVIYKAISI